MKEYQLELDHLFHNFDHIWPTKPLLRKLRDLQLEIDHNSLVIRIPKEKKSLQKYL